MPAVLKITNADRIVFPAVVGVGQAAPRQTSGHTKGDVVAYYGRAAERMLPHVRERPITIRRYPKGIQEAGFFQKNVQPHFPEYIGRIDLPRREGVTVHPSVQDAQGLMYLANQGAIEVHVPTVRAPALFYPDRLVIDLDPPSYDVTLARRAAVVVRDELAALGLSTVPVTTGSKGYHVVSTIDPTVDLETVSVTMQKLATLLAHRHAELLTVVFRVARRGPRVFVDWLRNQHAATGIAPFSLRARPGAPVAVPIGWDELDSTPSDAFTLASIDERLAAPDPLAGLAPADPVPFVTAVGAAFDEAGLALETFDRFRG